MKLNLYCLFGADCPRYGCGELQVRLKVRGDYLDWECEGVERPSLILEKEAWLPQYSKFTRWDFNKISLMKFKMFGEGV